MNRTALATFIGLVIGVLALPGLRADNRIAEEPTKVVVTDQPVEVKISQYSLHPTWDYQVIDIAAKDGGTADNATIASELTRAGRSEWELVATNPTLTKFVLKRRN